MINKDLLTSNSYEWYTPLYLFNELNEQFNFELDPCADKTNRLGLKYFYTKEEDGLLKDWSKFNSIYINPPYGRNISKWVEKAYNTFIKSNHSIDIVLLLPARTDTKWFHNYLVNEFCSVYFIKGRLRFYPSNNPAPFPSMICIFKKKE